MKDFLFFSNSSCCHCMIIKEWLKLGNFNNVLWIDTDDDEEDYCVKYNIRHLPTMINIDAYGKELKREVGNFAGRHEDFVSFMNN